MEPKTRQRDPSSTHGSWIKSASSADARSVWLAELLDTREIPVLEREVIARNEELFNCFALTYGRLTRLPRPERRALLRKRPGSLASLALSLALTQAPTLAATVKVGPGCSLVNAIRSANRNAGVGGCTAGSGADTITLPANSTHTLATVNNGYVGPSGLPVITSAITIAGNGSTIARSSAPGTPEFRLFVIGEGGNLVVQQTRVTGGLVPTPHRGGGIHNASGSLSLTGCTVSRNAAYAGGGIYNGTGRKTNLTDTVISGNTAGALGGGGIFNSAALFGSGPGNLLVRRGTIAGNSSPIGGGVQNEGNATLIDSTISGNTASADGGSGIFVKGGGGLLNIVNSSLSLIRCTISGNRSETSGGGVRNTQGGATLINSTISGNTAAANGGGLSNDFGRMTVLNGTVIGNTAISRGGGIFSGRRVDNLRSDVVLVGTLIAGNHAPTGGELYQEDGGVTTANNYNLFGHSGLTTGQALGGPGVILTGASDVTSTSNGTHPTAFAAILDPVLVASSGLTATHALPAESPAVDGMFTNCPIAGSTETDQRGVPRPQDGNADGVALCDIGAVERVRLGSVICNGLPATIVGTTASETINGTAESDVIQGAGGDDVIRGLGGDDVICGGPGQDHLLGGSGADRLFGGSGIDQLTGDTGFDRCDAGSGNPTESANCEQVTEYRVK